MQPRELQNYTVPDEMLKAGYALGIGIITRYVLKSGVSFFVWANRHGTGGLTPTVGAEFKKGQTLYDTLDGVDGAFKRKRFGMMSVDEGVVDESIIYYATNEKQKFARLTFTQTVHSKLSEEEFKKQYVTPMHEEAMLQGVVSNFFWRLDETVTKKDSKFKFEKNEERAEAAKNAAEKIRLARLFPVKDVILKKLVEVQSKEWVHEEKEVAPLNFMKLMMAENTQN